MNYIINPLTFSMFSQNTNILYFIHLFTFTTPTIKTKLTI